MLLTKKILRWNTYEQFKKRAFNVWKITFFKEKAWQDGVYDCSTFFKNYICKHVVGISIRTGLCKAPAAAKNGPIGEKWKCGRPIMAKKALIRQ